MVNFNTRFTHRYALPLPIASAPMANISGGKLAAAVTQAGGVGFIAGGYGDSAFIHREYHYALDLLSHNNQSSYDTLEHKVSYDPQCGFSPIGIGFITWKLTQNPDALTQVLEYPVLPRIIFLSFGDIAPFASMIHQAGCELWCQVQSMDQLIYAVEQGADVIIVQNSGGGGHGFQAQHARSAITFIPEATAWLHQHSPTTLLIAAGGICNAQSIMAALILGADAVLLGTALWLAEESLAPRQAQQRAIMATGDDTLQSNVLDFIRGLIWPDGYAIRTLKSNFLQYYAAHEDELITHLPQLQEQWRKKYEENNWEDAIIVGEAIGNLYTIAPVQSIINDLLKDFSRLQPQWANICSLPPSSH